MFRAKDCTASTATVRSIMNLTRRSRMNPGLCGRIAFAKSGQRRTPCQDFVTCEAIDEFRRYRFSRTYSSTAPKLFSSRISKLTLTGEHDKSEGFRRILSREGAVRN